LKKAHLLRCAQSPRSNVLASTPPLVDFSRASQLNLFDQPVKRVFQHSVKKKPAAGPDQGQFFDFKRSALLKDIPGSDQGDKNRFGRPETRVGPRFSALKLDL
jgi:hypothetical protein